jgi:hypothetical protein
MAYQQTERIFGKEKEIVQFHKFTSRNTRILFGITHCNFSLNLPVNV